jgi:hypothetical protein
MHALGALGDNGDDTGSVDPGSGSYTTSAGSQVNVDPVTGITTYAPTLGVDPPAPSIYTGSASSVGVGTAADSSAALQASQGEVNAAAAAFNPAAAVATDTSTLTNVAKGIGAGLATVLVRATGGQVQYNAQGQPIGFTTANGVASQIGNLLTGPNSSILIFGVVGFIAYKMLSSKN